MEKIINISLKHNRAKTILMVKDSFCLGTKDSIEFVNDILDKGEIIIRPSNFYLKYLEIFEGEYIDDTEKVDYIIEPDELTQEALNWMESLNDVEKGKIRLLVNYLGIGPTAG